MFFFKQKTAYEMRISDWSSDVCSSDLLLLPVWNKLPQDDVRVWRIDDAAGTSILGRIVMPAALEKLETAFGLESSIKLTPAELIEAARGGDGTLIPGLHGARLVSTMVNSSRRFEVRDFQRSEEHTRLKSSH